MSSYIFRWIFVIVIFYEEYILLIFIFILPIYHLVMVEPIVVPVLWWATVKLTSQARASKLFLDKKPHLIWCVGMGSLCHMDLTHWSTRILGHHWHCKMSGANMAPDILQWQWWKSIDAPAKNKCCFNHFIDVDVFRGRLHFFYCVPSVLLPSPLRFH